MKTEHAPDCERHRRGLCTCKPTPETARVEAIAAVLSQHVDLGGDWTHAAAWCCECGVTGSYDADDDHRAHLAAALAALLDGERAAGWDEALTAVRSDSAIGAALDAVIGVRDSCPRVCDDADSLDVVLAAIDSAIATARAGEVGGDE